MPLFDHAIVTICWYRYSRIFDNSHTIYFTFLASHLLSRDGRSALASTLTTSRVFRIIVENSLFSVLLLASSNCSASDLFCRLLWTFVSYLNGHSVNSQLTFQSQRFICEAGDGWYLGRGYWRWLAILRVLLALFLFFLLFSLSLYRIATCGSVPLGNWEHHPGCAQSCHSTSRKV
jgi:hypothetical protein